MVDKKSLKKYVFNKEVAAVWALAWLYPWYSPIFTQTSNQNINLVFGNLLSPLEFILYNLPIMLGGGIVTITVHIAFAVTVVFLFRLVVTKMTNSSHSENRAH